MGEVAIPRMQIDGVVRAVDRIARVTETLQAEVGSLSSRQVEFLQDLRALAARFDAFVESDRKTKALQLAETRIVKTRQQLDKEFGFYAEVRRSTTGFLQGVDHGMVSDDTARFVFEEALMKSSGYWLAWAMNALSSWGRDDKETAQRALSQALAKDSYKVSLLMTLTCRRLDRPAATAQWLRHFMRHQDPTCLDREFIILMDAVAHDLLGSRARVEAANTMDDWLDRLGGQANFRARQVERWAGVLEGLARPVRSDSYPTLRSLSAEWGQLEANLALTSVHRETASYFHGVMSERDGTRGAVLELCDGLLTRLVSEFDEAELPLREQEQRLQLIIDNDGDVAAAERQMKPREEAFQQHVDFSSLLTTAAMYPEQSEASPATRKFAVAKSKDWIVAAHQTVTDHIVAGRVADITISFDGWSGRTADGSNQSELDAGLDRHYSEQLALETEGAKVSAATMVVAAGGGALAVAGVVAGMWIIAVLGLAGAAYGAYQWTESQKKVGQLAADYEESRRVGAARLQTALAEVVQYRASWHERAANAPRTAAYLASISVAEHGLAGRPTTNAA